MDSVVDGDDRGREQWTHGQINRTDSIWIIKKAKIEKIDTPLGMCGITIKSLIFISPKSQKERKKECEKLFKEKNCWKTQDSRSWKKKTKKDKPGESTPRHIMIKLIKPENKQKHF